jgi:hypothetical protein
VDAETKGKIIRDMMGGMSLSDVCRQKGYPHRSTVYDELAADAAFADMYARACEIRADHLLDELISIADTPKIGEKRKIDADGSVEITEGDMTEHRRLQVDARKWAIAKMAPKKYGDKLDLNHSGEVRIAKVEMKFVRPEPKPGNA